MNEEMKHACQPVDLEPLIAALMIAEPDKLAQAKKKPVMLGWFVGQIMKQTHGKANPNVALEILEQKIGEHMV
jgi:aspartyl-tRNA(Asn)/glutamyl-tRNA(Gln) amidotransferase subunit B